MFIRILNFIFQNTYATPSTLHLKSRLTNFKIINVFYPPTKIKIKLANINIKSDTMTVIYIYKINISLNK